MTLLYVCSSAIAEPVLKVGILDFPPYYVMNEKTKQEEGIFVDQIKKTLDSAGLKYTFEYLPAKRLYLSLAKGEIDLWFGTTGVSEYE